MNRICSKAIKYGNHIDTDVIIPAHRLVHGSDIKYLSQFAMEVIDERFHEKISKGYRIIVAGENFGCGSSRQQAPEVLKKAGIKLIISDSFARIFFRNAINIGLPVFISQRISESVTEGDEIEIDFETGEIYNRTLGLKCEATPIPNFLREILEDGGLIPHLRKKFNVINKRNLNEKV